jgi:serine/threonine protein phosphatase 1
MRQHFANNIHGHDYVVGDVHGGYERLTDLLAVIKFDIKVDRLFSVGDLIDRGPDSAKCLELLNEPCFFSVLGNHEDMLMKASKDPEEEMELWVQNGGEWGLELDPTALAHYAAVLAKLPLVITVGEGANRFNVFHAEFFGDDLALDRPSYSNHMREQLLWGRMLIRDPNKKDLHRGLSKSFCGHTPVKSAKQIGSHVFIDTGCGYPKHTGKLTIARAADLVFFEG